jgi:hypothetical protein
MAVGTYFRLTARICSPKPGSTLCATASVASGVTSRSAGPVEAALLDGDFRDIFFATRALEFGVLVDDFLFVAVVVVIGKLEEDQPQHRVAYSLDFRSELARSFSAALHRSASSFFSWSLFMNYDCYCYPVRR